MPPPPNPDLFLLLLIIRPLPQKAPTKHATMKNEILAQGCPFALALARKNTRWILVLVLLLLIVGFLLITSLSVCKMRERDMLMLPPSGVWSQYCLFYFGTSH